jgi:hypothetical protein
MTDLLILASATNELFDPTVGSTCTDDARQRQGPAATFRESGHSHAIALSWLSLLTFRKTSRYKGRID